NERRHPQRTVASAVCPFLIFLAVLGSMSRAGTVVTLAPTQIMACPPLPRQVSSRKSSPRDRRATGGGGTCTLIAAAPHVAAAPFGPARECRHRRMKPKSPAAAARQTLPDRQQAVL